MQTLNYGMLTLLNAYKLFKVITKQFFVYNFHPIILKSSLVVQIKLLNYGMLTLFHVYKHLKGIILMFTQFHFHQMGSK